MCPVAYCDLHVDHAGGEVDHDRQHGHRGEADAPREEEEEDQAADEEAHDHGDAHVQLPANMKN